MSTECLYAGGWLCCLELPYLNTSIIAATGQVRAVGTPSHRKDSTLGSYRFYVCAGCHIPEPDGRIFPATGEHPAIGRISQIFDDVIVPSCPKQRATLYIPQFDRPIPASRGQEPFIRTEGQGSLHYVGMRLPGQMQGVAPLAPHPHFSPRAARRPIHSLGADCHRPGSIKGLGEDGVTKGGLRKRCILHLDALQIRSPDGEMREIETAQMPAKRSQEADEVGRSIALLLLLQRTQLAEQPKQLLLHRLFPPVDSLQAHEDRGHNQPLLRLPHIFLGSRLLERSEERRVRKECRSRWSPYH